MSKPDPKQADLNPDRVGHEGKYLTTDQGVRVEHTDDSLRAGDRGPTLIEDFHFREKLTASITSGSPSGLSTRAVPGPTGRLRALTRSPT
jgi:hypothetical protein